MTEKPQPADYEFIPENTRLWILCDELSKLDREIDRLRRDRSVFEEQLRIEAENTGTKFPLLHGDSFFLTAREGGRFDVLGFTGRPSPIAPEGEPF